MKNHRVAPHASQVSVAGEFKSLAPRQNPGPMPVLGDKAFAIGARIGVGILYFICFTAAIAQSPAQFRRGPARTVARLTLPSDTATAQVNGGHVIAAEKNQKGRYQMNRIITTVLCMLASFTMLNTADAQRHAVRVVIPFDFSASGVQLPAGAYTIATENGITSITKSGTRDTAFVRAVRVFDNATGDSKLIFSTYGDQHFLRKVLAPGVESLELVPSKAEVSARVQTANNRVQPKNNPGD